MLKSETYHIKNTTRVEDNEGKEKFVLLELEDNEDNINLLGKKILINEIKSIMRKN